MEPQKSASSNPIEQFLHVSLGGDDAIGIKPTSTGVEAVRLTDQHVQSAAAEPLANLARDIQTLRSESAVLATLSQNLRGGGVEAQNSQDSKINVVARDLLGIADKNIKNALPGASDKEIQKAKDALATALDGQAMQNIRRMADMDRQLNPRSAPTPNSTAPKEAPSSSPSEKAGLRKSIGRRASQLFSHDIKKQIAAEGAKAAEEQVETKGKERSAPPPSSSDVIHKEEEGGGVKSLLGGAAKLFSRSSKKTESDAKVSKGKDHSIPMTESAEPKMKATNVSKAAKSFMKDFKGMQSFSLDASGKPSKSPPSSLNEAVFTYEVLQSSIEAKRMGGASGTLPKHIQLAANSFAENATKKEAGLQTHDFGTMALSFINANPAIGKAAQEKKLVLEQKIQERGAAEAKLPPGTDPASIPGPTLKELKQQFFDHMKMYEPIFGKETFSSITAMTLDPSSYIAKVPGENRETTAPTVGKDLFRGLVSTTNYTSGAISVRNHDEDGAFLAQLATKPAEDSKTDPAVKGRTSFIDQEANNKVLSVVSSIAQGMGIEPALVTAAYASTSEKTGQDKASALFEALDANPTTRPLVVALKGIGQVVPNSFGDLMRSAAQVNGFEDWKGAIPPEMKSFNITDTPTGIKFDLTVTFTDYKAPAGNLGEKDKVLKDVQQKAHFGVSVNASYTFDKATGKFSAPEFKFDIPIAKDLAPERRQALEATVRSLNQ